MKIIAITNNKGGVLKTTLTTNIGAMLSKEHRVLIVDTDQQGNVSTTFGADADDYKYTLADVLLHNIDVEKAIKKPFAKLHVLPSNSQLISFSTIGISGETPEGIKDMTNCLKEKLQQVKNDYDYVIIDSAPSMDLLSISVINAADMIIVPTAAEDYSVKGLRTMINTLSGFNAKVDYVVPTLVDTRTNLHREMIEEIETTCAVFKIKVTKTHITKSIQAAKATRESRVPLVLTKKKTKSITQFEELVKEMGL